MLDKKFSTVLVDRELRFDGVSIVDTSKIPEFFLKGITPSQLRVASMDDEVLGFNSLVEEKDQLRESVDQIKIQMDWRVPEEYLRIDIRERALSILADKISILGYSQGKLLDAAARIQHEVEMIRRYELNELFCTIAFILDRFREEQVVWGVGRGSSCASYILFLFGLHSVDCIEYQIPMEEFFHD